MNIRSAVFVMISIKPQSINSVINRLPYSQDSIYNVIEEMIKKGDLIKIKTKEGMKVDIPKDYHHQKQREFYIKSLSYGVDPAILLRKTSQQVWKALDTSTTVTDLSKETNLSEKTVRKILQQFYRYDFVTYEKKKPIIVKKIHDHPIGIILNSMTRSKNKTNGFYTSGSSPFNEIITTPDEIEEILYDKIDESLTVKKTGFLVKGKKEKITVLESVPHQLTNEEIFIKQILTPEGVEDICIRLLVSKKINYKQLLDISIENNLVNLIGCYLDIINDINDQLIPKGIIKKFYNSITDKKIVFLKDEKQYGKSGWEQKYENKWNVDLYLEIGAIEHGVRGV